MMRRHVLSARLGLAAAVTVSAALAVSGCTGSSPQPTPSTGPTGSKSARTNSPSASGGSGTTIAGCRTPEPKVKAAPDAASLSRATAVMTSVAVRGWNAQAPAAKPSTLLGGMYINYRHAWDGQSNAAANTNIRTDGLSDSDASVNTRHDPLVDLVILRNLDALLSAGVRNSDLDLLRCRLQPVTAAEFVNYGPPRSWIYGQLIDLAELDPSGPWSDSAQRFATSLAKRYANGIADGDVRPDWIAESAAALVEAGARFNQSSWTDLGHRLAVQLCQTTANSVTGFFPGDATASNGQVTVKDPLVKAGSQAQLVDALLQVATATKDSVVTAAATKALGSLTSTTVGLADGKSGGWFYAINVDGSGVRTAYKETRQGWMVPLLRRAASTGLMPDSAATTAETIVRDRLYLASAGGYVYRVGPQFQAYVSSNNGVKVTEDWISTEATGIAIQALLGPLAG